MNKTIHYCWFGGNPLPELAQKCIASWEKYCPDYEIRQWNESNFDVHSCAYCSEAYEQKKWAFVSDYARFKILHDFGGLYFDTDVELVKPIDDIVAEGPFMGFEKHTPHSMVAPGLGLGAEPGMPIYKEILESYESSHFVVDRKIDFTSVVDRTTAILCRHGLQLEDVLQNVAGLMLYPSDYFCPLNYDTNILEQTENTRSIHWYDASWLDERMRKRQKRCADLRKRLPGGGGELIVKCYVKLSYLGEWFTTGQLINKLRSKLGLSKKEK